MSSFESWAVGSVLKQWLPTRITKMARNAMAKISDCYLMINLSYVIATAIRTNLIRSPDYDETLKQEVTTKRDSMQMLYLLRSWTTILKFHSSLLIGFNFQWLHFSFRHFKSMFVKIITQSRSCKFHNFCSPQILLSAVIEYAVKNPKGFEWAYSQGNQRGVNFCFGPQNILAPLWKK